MSAAPSDAGDSGQSVPVYQLDALIAANHHVAAAQRAVDETMLGSVSTAPPRSMAMRTAGSVQGEGPLRQDVGQAAPWGELHSHEGVAILGVTELQHPD